MTPEATRKRSPRHVLTLRLALRDTEPEVWRRVLVQSDLTLHALHRIFQILMQWYDYHLYMFTIGERRFEDGSTMSPSKGSNPGGRACGCPG